jgi:hypothetical protein
MHRITLAPILCLAFATSASWAQVETPCSNIQNAGGFTNATEIVAELALLDNTDVMKFVAAAQQENVTSFNLYQCTYKYDSEPVVLATAICDASNLRNCVVLAEYNETQCQTATLCPDILNQRPSFTVDCSGILDTYPSCALTCSSNTSDVSGMETCADVTDVPSPTAAPGGGGGSGGGSDTSTSDGTARRLALYPLAAFIGLLLSL